MKLYLVLKEDNVSVNSSCSPSPKKIKYSTDFRDFVFSEQNKFGEQMD